MTTNLAATRHYSVIVVGAGQSGLSMSYYLKEAGIDHLVLEKSSAMHSWKLHRWDSFCLVTPNWQCALPGYPYRGNDPHGFMRKDEIIEYLEGFARHVDAPARGVAAGRRLSRAQRARRIHGGPGGGGLRRLSPAHRAAHG